MKPSDVLSTRSRAYKELDLAHKDLTEAELLDLMVKEPTLLRRPLIVSAAGTAVGFNQKRMQELAGAD